ncbi:conserved membrane hypothetical protein [Vibrio chagasii]|nr:conserved membrane hypothetical protein [Vibrio chagasii]CAH7074877.1 conserved membrane hypothetical protein [Vibrio chagasii]CAH7104221.1 conserved membrane hypothetical protein [Vibrio chagasii]CAH7130434.1 conserved membrane hypothetical protein [Vibrio chagasii]CAH7208876.1 conserved membrane hypothetical protein [Vibrio chagasii]
MNLFFFKRKINFTLGFVLFLITTFYLIPSRVFDIPMLYIINVPLAFIFISKCLMELKIDKFSLYFLFYLVFLLFLTIGFSYYHAASDLYIIKVIIISIMLFFSSRAIVDLYHSLYDEYWKYYVLRNIILAVFVNVAFSILIIYSKDFGVEFYNIFGLSETARVYFELGRRISGMFESGFSILSVFYGFSVFITFIFMSNYNFSNRNVIYLYLFAALSSLAAVYSGRTGMILISSICLLSLILPSYFLRIKKSILYRVFFMVLIFLVLTFFIYTEEVMYFYMWAFSLFFENSSQISGDTVNYIINNMLIIPNDVIFGDGNFGRSNNMPYIDSDLGLILLTNFGGLIYSILFIGSFFVISFFLSICTKSSVFKPFVAVCFFMLPFLNLKDVYILGSSGVTQLIYLVLSAHFLSCVVKKKEAKY